MPPLPIDLQGVFLNIPYDEEFRSLYTAYIVGLCYLGFVPHIAAEIPGGTRRLDRILKLIKSCRFSIHDLSRVELSVPPHSTPRFNMPLELGMTITWADLNPGRHAFLVFESEPYRIQRSASDLNGTDACIHHGTAEGVLSELRSAFWRADAPTVPQMMGAHRFLEKSMESILERNGTRNLFAQGVFQDLCRLSTRMSELLRRAAGY
ncbi:MAG TPA: hypothetical protein VMU71_03535 [Terracidiphilus sp.]|nr:hypothetical protein [Terracidiphilus sp.]